MSKNKHILYTITNSKNGKVYVGLTSDYDRRVVNHKTTLNSYEHPNTPLLFDWHLDGADAFSFNKIKTFENSISKEEAALEERNLIRAYGDNSYNIAGKVREYLDGKDIYTKDDYAGEMNLKMSEKILILKAATLCFNNRPKMAKKLGISERSLYRKLIRHSLTDFI